MAAWPETIVPNYTLTITPKWQTLTTPLGQQNEQRTAKQSYPQYDVTVNFSVYPSFQDLMTIWNFQQARKGSFEGFDIYDPRGVHQSVFPPYEGLLVGVADGAADTYDIPGRSTSAHTVYFDAIIQPTGWLMMPGGGRSNSDRLLFTVAPPEGTIITIDFTGILRIPVRFQSDRMDFETFEAAFSRTGAIQLHGLKFA